MYHLNECWEEYYRELDPEKRRDLYRSVTQEHEDDGANAFRKELMDLRHTDPRSSGRRVDNFLWHMIILTGFRRPMYFVGIVREREINGIIRGLGLDGAQDWDEAKRAAAYWEYRNAADRYLSTCTGAEYAKKLFGIMHSTDAEKLTKTARDFYCMTVTAPSRCGREKDMELFIRALQDAFQSSSADAKRAWKEASGGRTA